MASKNKIKNDKVITSSIFAYMHNFGKTTKEAADNFCMSEPEIVWFMNEYPEQREKVLDRKNKGVA